MLTWGRPYGLIYLSLIWCNPDLGRTEISITASLFMEYNSKGKTFYSAMINVLKIIFVDEIQSMCISIWTRNKGVPKEKIKKAKKNKPEKRWSKKKIECVVLSCILALSVWSLPRCLYTMGMSCWLLPELLQMENEGREAPKLCRTALVECSYAVLNRKGRPILAQCTAVRCPF